MLVALVPAGALVGIWAAVAVVGVVMLIAATLFCTEIGRVVLVVAGLALTLWWVRDFPGWPLCTTDRTVTWCAK